MHIPIQTNLPRLDRLTVEWHGRHFSLPYFYRDGTGGPLILFVHGLGGAKENFHAAFQSPALADCTLATFDEPGTGLAAFDPETGLAGLDQSYDGRTPSNCHLKSVRALPRGFNA